MNVRLNYSLSIDVQRDLERELPDVAAAIIEDADAADRDWSDKVRRFVGGYLNDAENALGDALPEGFAVRIDDVAPPNQVTNL